MGREIKHEKILLTTLVVEPFKVRQRGFDTMLTICKYANKIGVPPSVVSRWLRQGLPYTISETGRRLINPIAAEEWLEEQKRKLFFNFTWNNLENGKQFVRGITKAIQHRLKSSCHKAFKTKSKLGKMHILKGFSLVIVPHNSSGKTIQFTFDRRKLIMAVPVIVLSGFVFSFLLGVALAFPRMSRIVDHQNAEIAVLGEENIGLRARNEELLEYIEERERFTKTSSQGDIPKLFPSLSDVQAENPNVRIPDEVQKLAEYSSLFRELLEEKLEYVMKAEKQIKEYQAESQITPNIWPTNNGRITSGYGIRPAVFGVYVSRGRLITHTFHAGVDIGANIGEPVYATADGTVIFARFEGAWGGKIEIKHGEKYITIYAHLSKILVSEGDEVKRGQVIGEVGDTGKTTGAHLHYEVKLHGVNVDPIRYVPAK